MKQKRAAAVSKMLKRLAKKGPIEGKVIVEEIRVFEECDYSLLYALMEKGIIEAVRIGKNIEDYTFRIIGKESTSDAIFGVLSKDAQGKHDFTLLASYPQKQPSIQTGDIEDLYPRLCRLIMSAKKTLIFINPYFDKNGLKKILPYLSEASKRGVKISLIARADGTSDQFIEVIKSEVPKNLTVMHFGGSGYFLHAKCIIADEESAYIGSANITGTSLGSNLELGVFFAGDKVRPLLKFLDSVLNPEA